MFSVVTTIEPFDLISPNAPPPFICLLQAFSTNGRHFPVVLTVKSQQQEGMSSGLGHGSQRTCDTVMSVMKQFILLAFVYFSHCCASIVESSNNQLVYNNQFAVNIPNATEVLVQLIAEKHGFRSLGQVRRTQKWSLKNI